MNSNDTQMKDGRNSVQGTFEDDVVGYIPGYAIPNVSSLLPDFTNSEQDFIYRTFSTGNYDFIKTLPDSIKHQQVAAARTARKEAAKHFLSPAPGGPLLKSQKDNIHGLFQDFGYVPSEYSLAREVESKLRIESEAKRLAVGGKEFTPTGFVGTDKSKDLAAIGGPFPHLAGTTRPKKESAPSTAKQRGGSPDPPKPPFFSPGVQKLPDKPSLTDAFTMMNNVRQWILKDWEQSDVTIFENRQDCWVIRISLQGVDSLDGLLAYMNVFLRCNALVNSYGLVKVTEFWHTVPGDGHVYYVVRPPWIRLNTLQTFFNLYPDEKDYRTSHATQELERARPKNGLDMDEPQEQLLLPSRMEWGRNFLTGTAASASLGRSIP